MFYTKTGTQNLSDNWDEELIGFQIESKLSEFQYVSNEITTESEFRYYFGGFPKHLTWNVMKFREAIILIRRCINASISDLHKVPIKLIESTNLNDCIMKSM